jgi:hypothetical protein
VRREKARRYRHLVVACAHKQSGSEQQVNNVLLEVHEMVSGLAEVKGVEIGQETVEEEGQEMVNGPELKENSCEMENDPPESKGNDSETENDPLESKGNDCELENNSDPLESKGNDCEMEGDGQEMEKGCEKEGDDGQEMGNVREEGRYHSISKPAFLTFAPSRCPSS